MRKRDGESGNGQLGRHTNVVGAEGGLPSTRSLEMITWPIWYASE